MHRLFLGLLPGGAPVKKSVGQYQALLATVRPRDLAGKTCRRMAAEELEDLHRLDAKLKAMKAELKAAVLATGSHLMDIHGIGRPASPGSTVLPGQLHGKAVHGALAVIHLTNQRSSRMSPSEVHAPTVPAATPPRPYQLQGQ